MLKIFCVMLSVVLLLQEALFSMTLKENLSLAQTGDYLVAQQGRNYVVLFVRKKDHSLIQMDEITLPLVNFKKFVTSWKDWLMQHAAGNTCWLTYDIDQNSGKIVRCYSYTQRSWCSVDREDNYLATILNLEFTEIPLEERKKVGVAPSEGMSDWRRIWQPTLVVDGEERKGISFNAYRARWPEDNTELSGKPIEIYLPSMSQDFPVYFPYWLQVTGWTGKARIRVVDSGRLNFEENMQN